MDATLERSISNLAPYSELLTTSAGRRAITKDNPLLFALIYLSHHLKADATDNKITFSEFHNDLYEYALEWTKPLGNMKEHRDAFIAPRESAKSSMLFLILPMWAAAHGHVRFIAAFADSATQAENHLASFKRELDINEMLREDYPELCTPAKMSRVGTQLAHNRSQIHQANGFVFMARGIDSSILGTKVGVLRPEVIILDDCESGEASYSIMQAKNRLITIQDDVFYLNPFARVIMVGTVTMGGSIMDQLVKHSEGQHVTDGNCWICEENIRVNYYPGIITSEDGEQRSLWPDKWSIETLIKMQGTRSFAKNFMNKPMDTDGIYWTPELIKIKSKDSYKNTIISIDPAVTNTSKSDWTGIGVISRTDNELYVRHATHVKLSPQELRATIMRLLEAYTDVTAILIETNQGGNLWNEVFGGLGVKIRTVHQKNSKETRASKALMYYEKGKVFHTEHFTVLEEEYFTFPSSAYDDTLDCVVSGLLFFIENNTKSQRVATSRSYV